ncbi:xylulokinase [Oceanivirga salmonicida]|uniref:xylulokinase n=1 Tax=Oceanivirga salmonicida TaxID=1769291 RepID=UPI0012E13CB9|nr:xylulokinase [Oceanivirga salmonicida]
MYLGIDLGTSGIKMLVINENGEIITSTSKSYEVNYSNNGWTDQNPNDWVEAMKLGLKSIKDKIDINMIKGIGISGQMHGLVILDENKDVVYPVILWNDQRTVKQSEYLNNEVGKDKLIKYTSNISFTGFTASKIMWIKENEPKIFEKIRHIMLPKDYLVYILTGELSSDTSDASGTLFFDVANRKWSTEMINILGMSKSQLPKMYESYEIVGKLKESIKKEFDISVDIPVVAGGGDNACGAVGAGVVNEGKILISLGTSGVVFIPKLSWSLPEKSSMHTFCDSMGNYHFMGVILSAFSCLKWWVENIHGGNYEKLLKEANESPVGSNNLYFLPYLTGERTPHSDSYARGSFIGLTPNHTRGDMTRSIIEGIAFALYDSYKLVDDINPEIIRIIGGGAKSKLAIEIITNIFNMKTEILEIEEGPSYGAAILAMFGVENIDTKNEKLEKLIKIKEVLTPNKVENKEYLDRYNVYKELYNSLKNNFIQISNLKN